VESRLRAMSSASAVPGFRLLLEGLLPLLLPQRIWTQKPLSSRSTPCMICVPLPRNGNDKCSGDDPAFLCHVPAALCSFALRSLAWVTLPRRNGSFDSTSLHFFGQAIEIRSARAWSSPRDSRACLGLGGLRRRLASAVENIL
jgi:hypothetical protein